MQSKKIYKRNIDTDQVLKKRVYSTQTCNVQSFFFAKKKKNLNNIQKKINFENNGSKLFKKQQYVIVKIPLLKKNIDAEPHTYVV